MESVRASGIGTRRLEAEKGLPKWSLRGILDSRRPQLPSVDRAVEICEAIGLECYVGSHRDMGESRRIASALGLPHNTSVDTVIRAIEALRGQAPTSRNLRRALTESDRSVEGVTIATNACSRIDYRIGQH